jgi:small subunit ribosomal protein S20
VAEAVVSLDKAAEKGIIHANNAARRKSRLMKKLNEALAPAPLPVEPEEAG